MATCPECGAQADCQAMFDQCLALEFSDPGYGAVHHLTVAAFMLQHSSRLSLQGWQHMRQLLADFLIAGKSPQEIRKQNREVVNSANRTWKIISRDGQPKIKRRSWSKTIDQVRLESVDAYCGDITAWAASVLSDCADAAR